MASKKKLKKSISNISGELFTECLFCRLYIPGVNQDKADEILTKILQKQDDFIQRANHPDGKDNPKLIKKHYQLLTADIKKHIEEIITDIQKMNDKSK